MKVIETKVYKFEELSKQAQQKAIELMYDINFHSDWWDNVYYNAKMIGLEIKSFDIDRASYCKVDFLKDVHTICDLIKENHGEITSTYKEVLNFESSYDELVAKYSDGIDTSKVIEENNYDFDNEADELEYEFKKELGECYLSILRNEYEYLTSEDAIKDTIIANDYDFLEDGTQF